MYVVFTCINEEHDLQIYLKENNSNNSIFHMPKEIQTSKILKSIQKFLPNVMELNESMENAD